MLEQKKKAEFEIRLLLVSVGGRLFDMSGVLLDKICLNLVLKSTAINMKVCRRMKSSRPSRKKSCLEYN